MLIQRHDKLKFIRMKMMMILICILLVFPSEYLAGPFDINISGINLPRLNSPDSSSMGLADFSQLNLPDMSQVNIPDLSQMDLSALPSQSYTWNQSSHLNSQKGYVKVENYSLPSSYAEPVTNTNSLNYSVVEYGSNGFDSPQMPFSPQLDVSSFPSNRPASTRRFTSTRRPSWPLPPANNVPSTVIRDDLYDPQYSPKPANVFPSSNSLPHFDLSPFMLPPVTLPSIPWIVPLPHTIPFTRNLNLSNFIPNNQFAFPTPFSGPGLSQLPSLPLIPSQPMFDFSRPPQLPKMRTHSSGNISIPRDTIAETIRAFNSSFDLLSNALSNLGEILEANRFVIGLIDSRIVPIVSVVAPIITNPNNKIVVEYTLYGLWQVTPPSDYDLLDVALADGQVVVRPRRNF